MALPTTLNTASPANTDSPAQGDDQIRALKTLISDLFGFPTDPTSLTAAPFSISAAGVVTVSQGFVAGSVSAASIFPAGDANTGIYFSAADTVSIAAGGVNVLEAFVSATVTNVVITSTGAGVQGPILTLTHSSTSPADGDSIGNLNFNAKDDSATARTVGQIAVSFDDVTSTTMDSTMIFNVMSAANATSVNTSASLSSLGVWTDASAASGKRYIGNVDSVLEKAKSLKTLGVYVGANVLDDKLATAERHFSPTAEEFVEVFGLGVHPSKARHPGIAPKDVAWLAVKMAMELDARVAALEAK